MEAIREAGNRGHNWVLDADIRGYFGSIDHGSILVRYADDYVVLRKSESQCTEALTRVTIVMRRLGLEVHSEKTRMVSLARGKEGCTFLGWTVRKRMSIQCNPRKHSVQRWPSPKAMERIRDRVHEITKARGNQAQAREFNKLDTYVDDRVLQWQQRRGGQHTRFRRDRWPRERLRNMGLHRLRGTVRDPQAAVPRKHGQENSSVSCVPENGTHSLKGGAGNGSR